MKFKTLAAALTMAGAIGLPAMAGAAVLVNSDPNSPFVPFGGFDWTSGSAAFTTDFTATAGSTFNLTYFGNAGAITKTDGSNFDVFTLDTSANGTGLTGALGALDYEYTVVAKFQEQVVSCGADSCSFKILSGTFDIYYDESPDAFQVNGTGYMDGTKIISGTIDPSLVDQLFNNVTGGQADLTGKVTYTNAAYINPALVDTNITSTLQLGSAQTTFTRPTAFDGTAIPGTDGNGTVVFQADANQSFAQAVPEPASLALMGLALFGVGAASRRRRS